MNDPENLPDAVTSSVPLALDHEAGVASVAAEELTERLEVLEETFEVSKRQVVTGTVRVSTRTETHAAMAEVMLDHRTVDITTVPVGRIVDTTPQVRTEGDMTIVPIVEERFVVVKQLFLKEELHIRQQVQHQASSVPVQLRRQTATIERLDAAGSVVAGPVPHP